MRRLLIADEERDFVQSVVNRAYMDVSPNLPLSMHIVTTVDAAVEELRRSVYPLVLTSEFIPDPVEGMNVLDVVFGGDVLRLLEFCVDYRPQTKVCIVSSYSTNAECEELYRSFPCVIDVFMRTSSDREYKRQYKRLRKLLDDFAGVKMSL
ncbi:MAG TPA: hypothetical protein VM223_10830 [Planctomycetota bacterium]|nr:hypothetical protein [Planctomycetota bacterium]